MTTMPVTFQQERIPIAIGAPGASAPTAAALGFGDVIRILRQRIFLILFLWFAITGLAGGFTYAWDKDYLARAGITSSYRATAYVEIESPIPKTPLSMDTPLVQVDLLDRYVANQIVRVKSESVLSGALSHKDVMETDWYLKAKSEGRVEGLVDELRDDLEVKQIPSTGIMTVSFSTANKLDAPKIVNTVVTKYLAATQEGSITDARKEYDKYREQTNAKKNLLLSRRKEKADFVESFRTPGVTEGLNVEGEAFRALSEAVTKLEAEKLQFKAAYDNLRGLASDQIAVSPQMQQMIQQDPQVYATTNQLAGLHQNRQIYLRRLGPGHREIQQIDAAIEGAQATLAELQLTKEKEYYDYQLKSAEQAYQNATQAELQLRERLVEQEAKQQDIDRKMAEYRSIEEDVHIQEEEYAQLNQFTNQLGLMIAGEGSSRFRSSQAVPPRKKHAPRPEIIVPAGSFLGLMFGVGLALLLELMDTTVKTSRDLSRHVHVPILGTIPDVDDEEMDIEQVELATRTSPRSMVAEAFRTIRTNLLLSAPAERQRSVLIASAKPEEGRTTVATNLALSLALGGRRVLLIDANFHRPAIQRFFPAPSSSGGLSNILIGQATLNEVTVNTEVPNLDVLPSGPIPPNPTELLAGSYLKRMIADAHERYDQIIFDGPPVLLVSDSLVLAGAVDGVILVCRAKSTSRGVAMRGRELLERVNGRIFGAVLNAAQVARGGYFREQIRSYYDYQPEASLTAASAPALPPSSTPPQT